MSILERVHTALQENPNITVIGLLEGNFLPNKAPGGWIHIRDIFVAPSTPDIYYDIEALQSFMKSLIPEIPPTSMDPFKVLDDGIGFGKLYFDEVIGTEKLHRESTIHASDFKPPEDCINGVLTIDQTQELWRRTIVRVFPSALVATEAYHSNISWHTITTEHLCNLRDFSR